MVGDTREEILSQQLLEALQYVLLFHSLTVAELFISWTSRSY